MLTSNPFSSCALLMRRMRTGIGLFFSAFMLLLTTIQARYTAFSPKSSEEFSSASRSVKPGLIASGIVSAWTWAATLLQSSAVAYKYGISGPWWYGAGATIQVLLFAMLAAKLKLNAPYAHTWLEIVGTRWGKTAHLIFMFFGLATNIIVSSMLILGGSATVTDLTGMDTLAACFLIPLGVVIYVIVGGMRSTLLCDYTHTTVLFAIILTFVFTVYTTSPKIGSTRRMHELLTAAAGATPVPGNAHGSYLTMRSKDGLIFGVINIIGNFATVFQDQAYWQRAIASRPETTVKAYLVGGLAWFAIPFTFATTLGLSAVALRGDPDMRPLSAADVSAGLPAAAAAAALMGQAGAAALLVLLFLAVTSATSAELIAVSSLLTYDVFKKYIKPNATDSQLLQVGHYMVGPENFPMLAGNLASIGVGGIIATVTSLIWPDDFDFDITRAINNPSATNPNPVKSEEMKQEGKTEAEDFERKEEIRESEEAASPSVIDSTIATEEQEELDPVKLKSAFRFAAWSSLGLLLVLIILIPLPLFFAQTIYGVGGLSAWVIIGLIWTFMSAFSVVLYPLWESREALHQIGAGIIKVRRLLLA
ncbi:hypothetical protein HHX47_DHR10000378 [Lentinula edodes]|nr:hypothetical protein HHX47_DHR10000378 [Lentinula edodes]